MLLFLSLGLNLAWLRFSCQHGAKSGHFYRRNSYPLEQNIIPALENIFYDKEAYYVQQDGSLPHYHLVVRAFLITNFLSDG